MKTNLVSTRHLLWQLALLAAVTLALLFWQTPTAQAGSSIVVNTLTDTSGVGLCTLRDAINAANNASNIFACTGSGSVPHTITFSVSGTIVITGYLPYVSQSLTIDGGNKIAVSGGGTQNILATTGAVLVLNIYNLTLENGYSNSYHGAALINQSTVNISNTQFLTNSVLNNSGGAIINFGTMGIYSSTFSGNQSTRTVGSIGGDGGAIINSTFGGGGFLAITNTTFFSNSSNVLGGAIDNGGFLTVTNSIFTSNQTGTDGGAIYGDYLSVLRILGSTFTGNSAISTTNSFGGAIEALNPGPITILNSTFSNNHTVKDYGGAIAIQNSPNVVIRNSTISNNIAGNGNSDGGGIDIYASTIAITNSAIFGNQAYGGGGIHAGSVSTMTIANTTISGNSAQDNGGGILIDTSPVTLTLNNVTIANNSAGNNLSFGDGGGLNIVGTIRVKNSIIAGNSDKATGTNNPDCTGTLITLGNNLLGDSTGCSGPINGANGDKVGNSGSPIDPLLGPLSNLGGPTLVLPLKPGSPASDAGSNATCATTDQRGVARPINGTCDMGAFEGLGYWLNLPLIIK